MDYLVPDCHWNLMRRCEVEWCCCQSWPVGTFEPQLHPKSLIVQQLRTIKNQKLNSNYWANQDCEVFPIFLIWNFQGCFFLDPRPMLRMHQVTWDILIYMLTIICYIILPSLSTVFNICLLTPLPECWKNS